VASGAESAERHIARTAPVTGSATAAVQTQNSVLEPARRESNTYGRVGLPNGLLKLESGAPVGLRARSLGFPIYPPK
jgi:hypothetical protein